MSLALPVVTACGSSDSTSDGGVPTNYPTMAPTTAHGDYEMIEVVTRSGPLALDGPVGPTVRFDVVTGELSIEPACNQYLGSFTLGARGEASFTITGGTAEPCPGNEEREQTILDLFGRLDQWSEAGDSLELRGPASQLVTLRRR